MAWLMRILIGLGIALALVIAFVIVIGNLGTSEDKSQALSISVGNRTVMVAGHYKNLAQESIADGIKVVVDGHEITVAADQLTVDGETQVIEPDQDVVIYVGENGKLQVKVVQQNERASKEAL